MSENVLNLSHHWIDPEGYIYLRQDTSDAPSKDYFQLLVTPDLTVSFRVWKIAPPFKSLHHLAPQAYLSTYEQFKTDQRIRDAIEYRLKGELTFLDNLLAGQFNFLDHLKRDLQIYIVSFLDVCSVLRLSETSKYFRELCADDSVWKRHFMSGSLRYYATPRLMEIVDQHGWKAFYIITMRIAESTDGVEQSYILRKMSMSNPNTERRNSKFP